LRDLLTSEDADAIKTATEELMTAMHPIAEKAYAKAHAAEEQSATDTAEEPQVAGETTDESDSDTVDVEFHEDDE
jgi:hypothetical protein